MKNPLNQVRVLLEAHWKYNCWYLWMIQRNPCLSLGVLQVLEQLLSYPQTVFRFLSLKLQFPGRIMAKNMRQAWSLLLLRVVLFHQGTSGELSVKIRDLPQQQLQWSLQLWEGLAACHGIVSEGAGGAGEAASGKGRCRASASLTALSCGKITPKWPPEAGMTKSV